MSIRKPDPDEMVLAVFTSDSVTVHAAGTLSCSLTPADAQWGVPASALRLDRCVICPICFVWADGQGVRSIADERQRQIEELGHGFDHDLAHVPGELALAAVSYAFSALPWLGPDPWNPPMPSAGRYWPWADQSPEPCRSQVQVVRALEKAGALIAAELDAWHVRNDDSEPF